MTTARRGVLLSLLATTCLWACAQPHPTNGATAEVAIAPAPPVTSSWRGDSRVLAPAASGDRAGTLASGPTEEDRDRDSRMRDLPRRLLESEAQQLSQLLGQTRAGSPDHAMVMLRTAHTYGALEGELWREGDRERTDVARRAALATYQRFLKEYPTHQLAPEARYFAGIENERLQRLDEARKLWLQLIIEHPAHPFVPACYYAFGVLFRAEAATDPSKTELATQAFKEVMKFPDSTLANRAKAFVEEQRLAQP